MRGICCARPRRRVRLRRRRTDVVVARVVDREDDCLAEVIRAFSEVDERPKRLRDRRVACSIGSQSVLDRVPADVGGDGKRPPEREQARDLSFRILERCVCLRDRRLELPGAPEQIDDDGVLRRRVQVQRVAFSLRFASELYGLQPARSRGRIGLRVVAGPSRVDRVPRRSSLLPVFQHQRRAEKAVRQRWEGRIVELPPVLRALDDLDRPLAAGIDAGRAVATPATALHPGEERASRRLRRTEIQIGRTEAARALEDRQYRRSAAEGADERLFADRRHADVGQSSTNAVC